jgi:hypothetical protein
VDYSFRTLPSKTLLVERCLKSSSGRITVPGYRLYILDGAGHFSRRIEMTCEDDAEAFLVVSKHKHEHGLELWEGARCVGIFPAPGHQAPKEQDRS